MHKHKAQGVWLLGAGLLAASFAAVPDQEARLDPAPELAVIRSVGYADLNLRSPAGAAELHRRLRAAAAEVCGPAVQACKYQALEGAMARIPAPALVAYNAQWKLAGEPWIGPPAGKRRSANALLSRR